MAAFDWFSIRTQHGEVEVYRRRALPDDSILTVHQHGERHVWAHRGPATVPETGAPVVRAEGWATSANLAEAEADAYWAMLCAAQRSLDEIRQFTPDEICDLFELTEDERVLVRRQVDEHRALKAANDATRAALIEHYESLQVAMYQNLLGNSSEGPTVPGEAGR